MKKTPKSQGTRTQNRGGILSRLREAIFGVVATIPSSIEPKSSVPQVRVRELCEAAARRSARNTGLAALAPGALGLLTLLPDLMAIWKIQSQLVADIASVYGKSASLGREQMLFCVFEHAASESFRDVVYRAGNRYLVRPVNLRLFQKMVVAIGVKVSQRVIGKGVARFLPMVGAAAVAGFAYYDTQKVGATALALFSSEIVVEGEFRVVMDVTVRLTDESQAQLARINGHNDP